MGLLLESLDDEDGVEDVVPDLAGDAETEVEVLVVMRKVVLLHLFQIGREASVVQSGDLDFSIYPVQVFKGELTRSAYNRRSHL